MLLTQYQVDAFSEKLFEGNPAAVVPLQNWLDDNLMQQIAAENNLSETAFFVKEGENYHIRWFTPEYEVPLCGHATIASSYVIFNYLNPTIGEIQFTSSSGILKVTKNEDAYILNFPIQEAVDCEIPYEMTEAFGKAPVSCLQNQDYIAVYDDEEFVKKVIPNFEAIKQLDKRAVMMTAPSEKYDFVSRFFIPSHGINEDPVTGSSFTRLAPYWAARLGKNKLTAKQVSKRSGKVELEVKDDRVLIKGKAILFMKAEIYL